MNFLLPYFADKIPIGIATRKHIRLNTAKQIDEKFVPSSIALEYSVVISSVTVLKSGTANTV